ncbi:helix-turn-helix domain-containing protein [Pantoea sp.]|uniref:helix-turn-helix domain-containing protein n=1 Tax=Pantoea sp. TaxID=69393 RepID=UPI00289ED1C1|nr:helix-turn-helix domain-containing protein [Pantoea sp.]
MERHEHIIHELSEWIGKNINRPLRIEDVAERAGYSKWHLQRMFHRVMHVSLGNYIRNKKLYLAAQDLIEGKDSVITISVKYGYESQQSFTRTFVKKYRVPPATFRRINRHTFYPCSGYMQ